MPAWRRRCSRVRPIWRWVFCPGWTPAWICLANAQHPRVAGDTPASWNLAVYQAEAHIGISSGTGYQLLGNAVASQNLARRIRLELPGFLGLSGILSTSDLIATLPRHIGETLARSTGLNGLRVLPCPFELPGFTASSIGTPATTTTPATAGWAGFVLNCL